MANRIKQTLKNYWLLWTTISVGIVGLALQLFGNACFRVPTPKGLNTLVPIVTCPVRDFVAPITIILIVWLAILVTMIKTREMVRGLRQGNFGIDILAIIAIAACLITQEFWAAYIIILMLSSGETLEKLADRRARHELSALIKRRPQSAHLVIDDTISNVPLAKIKLGDRLLVKENEVIPVDGVLASSHATMDESSLTGESMPVDKSTGDKIISGTICQTNKIYITATSTAANSYYSQIIHLVEEAEARPSHFVNLANRYAVPFTIASLIIASLAWYMSNDFNRFAEVLVVASPCPLILAAPIAFVSGMSRCSKRGIIVKGGDTLEQIARADVFAFDKTGTITTDRVQIDHIDSTRGYTPQMIVAIVAAVEANSTHVLASSVINYANTHNIRPAPAHSIRESTGGGVFATIDHRRIVAGNQAFLESNKITGIPTNLHNQTSVLVAVNGKYIGAIYFTDTVRRGSKSSISRLRHLGVHDVIMLTGDRQQTAERIGHAVGIDKIYSQLSPTDKVKIIDNYRQNGRRVAMIGDGINDAPVLATANVGVAMGVMGSTVAGETADAIITSSYISRIAELRFISKRTMTIAKQSVVAGIIICLSLEVVALFGFIPAIAGAFLQEVIDVLTMLNALRANK